MDSPDSSTRRVTVLDEGGPNSIAVANGIVGDEWTLWIVQRALGGLTQYSEYLHAGPISSAVLTARLARLVEVDVMERVPYNARPPRHDYRLTARGRAMWPILLTMWAWERAWVDGPAPRLPAMRHTTCGAVFSPVLVCAACDQETVARDVSGEFGPSGGWSRSIPSATTRRRSHSGSRPDELVVQTMAMIGNRWSTALLGAAFLGATRFGEFEQRVGAPPTIVAERLRSFCEIGVLEQSPNPQRPDWIVYRLSTKGRAFFPVMASVLEWGRQWFVSPEGPALRLEHAGCGRTFHPRLRCSECHERLRGADVEIVRDGRAARTAV
ncbi:helix-turn-helix domain-containing protein [Pseudonocardia sp. 73-21]|uniref:winged helix-turn-helix transcriptional regulator n=1 Tax=Pseudonocardia sp. 73-21 TaxID=1895809 RepID=UPI000963D8F1|nr:helix-turn-helix domain-containing protein [Pseudonocardia sp. 73-21]OJY43929.1 MAG: transcriptional regulator [Pseudonocardia sp. 73-21]